MTRETKRISVEFHYASFKHSAVIVKAWADRNQKWNWNVYAVIRDSHTEYDNNELLLNAPLHGGCTYNAIKTEQPFELEYDWQKLYTSKVLGSDYNHIYDNSEYHPSPMTMGGDIPHYIERDAEELAAWLENLEGASDDNS